MALQFIEHAKNIEISDDELNHGLIKALNRCVSEESILINDYYMFRKEVKAMIMTSIIWNIRSLNNEGLSLQESVNRVHEMILEKDKQILKLYLKRSFWDQKLLICISKASVSYWVAIGDMRWPLVDITDWILKVLYLWRESLFMITKRLLLFRVTVNLLTLV